MWLAHHIMPHAYMHKFKVKVYMFYVLLTIASQYMHLGACMCHVLYTYFVGYIHTLQLFEEETKLLVVVLTIPWDPR